MLNRKMNPEKFCKLGNTKVEKVFEGRNKELTKLIVKYHTTVIVTVYDPTSLDAVIKLNSGGWKTVTTLRRMNQFSEAYYQEFKVYQKNFSWFVKTNGRELTFSDNMTFKRGPELSK